MWVWGDSRNEIFGKTNTLVFLVGISFSTKHYVNSFNKYLLNVYFVPGTVLGTGAKE